MSLHSRAHCTALPMSSFWLSSAPAHLPFKSALYTGGVLLAPLVVGPGAGTVSVVSVTMVAVDELVADDVLTDVEDELTVVVVVVTVVVVVFVDVLVVESVLKVDEVDVSVDEVETVVVVSVTVVTLVVVVVVVVNTVVVVLVVDAVATVVTDVLVVVVMTVVVVAGTVTSPPSLNNAGYSRLHCAKSKISSCR